MIYDIDTTVFATNLLELTGLSLAVGAGMDSRHTMEGPDPYGSRAKSTGRANRALLNLHLTKHVVVQFATEWLRSLGRQFLSWRRLMVQLKLALLSFCVICLVAILSGCGGVSHSLSQSGSWTITLQQSGGFAPSEQGQYAITVTNSTSAATSGPVTVSDSLPGVFQANNTNGAGWTCTLSPLSCTTSNSIAAGANSTITVNVNVDLQQPGALRLVAQARAKEVSLTPARWRLWLAARLFAPRCARWRRRRPEPCGRSPGWPPVQRVWRGRR